MTLIKNLKQSYLKQVVLLAVLLCFCAVQGLISAQTSDLAEYKDEYIQKFSNVVSFVIDRPLTSDEMNRLQEASAETYLNYSPEGKTFYKETLKEITQQIAIVQGRASEAIFRELLRSLIDVLTVQLTDSESVVIQDLLATSPARAELLAQTMHDKHGLSFKQAFPQELSTPALQSSTEILTLNIKRLKQTINSAELLESLSSMAVFFGEDLDSVLYTFAEGSVAISARGQISEAKVLEAFAEDDMVFQKVPLNEGTLYLGKSEDSVEQLALAVIDDGLVVGAEVDVRTLLADGGLSEADLSAPNTPLLQIAVQDVNKFFIPSGEHVQALFKQASSFYLNVDANETLSLKLRVGLANLDAAAAAAAYARVITALSAVDDGQTQTQLWGNLNWTTQENWVLGEAELSLELSEWLVKSVQENVVANILTKRLSDKAIRDYMAESFIMTNTISMLMYLNQQLFNYNMNLFQQYSSPSMYTWP